MSELFVLVVGVAFSAGIGYMLGLVEGRAKGRVEAKQKYSKPAEEALAKAEKAVHKLHTKQEEYNVAIAAARQAYMIYATKEEMGEPEKAESPRLQ